MNELQAHEMELQKRQIIFDQSGLCGYCKKRITPYEVYTIAHRLAKHKWRLEKYGPEVMHHRLNLVATHPGNCNDGVMVNIQMTEGKELLTEIFNDLGLEIPEEFLK